MEEFRAINLGVYFEHLKQTITELNEKMKKETDPYARWNVVEQKKLAEKLLQDYDRLILKQ